MENTFRIGPSSTPRPALWQAWCLEGKVLAVRTRIFECGKDCVNHRRFRALDNPETGASEVCVTSAKSTKSKKRAKSSKRSKSAKAASAPVGPKLSRAQLEVLRQRKFYEARWCSGLNFCQQGVSPAVTLKGFRNGKGFGVVTDVRCEKVSTYVRTTRRFFQLTMRASARPCGARATVSWEAWKFYLRTMGILVRLVTEEVRRPPPPPPPPPPPRN